MVSVQSIKEQFDELGIEPSEEVINKCIEICIRNDVDDPVEFVEQWMAYSVSKLSGAEPTVEYLRDMESHEYSASAKHHRQGSSAATPSHHHPELREESQRRRHQQPKSHGGGPGGDSGLVIYSNADTMSSIESDVLGSYGCITPKAKKPVSRLHGQTPDRNKAHFSPASYSPIASSKRSDPDGPSNSGNVVYTFGNPQLLKQTGWSSSGTVPASVSSARRTPLSIGVQLFKGGQLTSSTTTTASSIPTFMSDECKYMYDSIYDRVLTYGDRIYEGGKDICLRLKASAVEAPTGGEESIPQDDRGATLVEQVAVHHVDFPSTEPISVLGRIVVHPERKDDGRLAIVDFDELTLRCTKLDFSRMRSWAVFPGQTVLLEGVNPRGNAFEVRQIHYERTLELPAAPTNLGKELNLVIAAAPFTEKDDLLYEKLSDLLAYCTNNLPDVLILTGPFGASSNPLFATIAEPFEVYFEKIMVNIMNSVPPTTEVLVVANHDDIASHFVYPSFPYNKLTSHHFRNLHFLPDPCVVTINGLELAITTADVIKDLTDAECSGNPAGDRIKRAFNYVFHHRSFYPLNPPPDTVPLDVDLLAAFGRLPRVPNMMICPGDLKCYVRDVNGCVCINPGHLVDHESGGGTFARVLVQPPEAKTTTPYNYVACQVVKS